MNDKNDQSAMADRGDGMNWVDEVEQILSEVRKSGGDLSGFGLIVSPSTWEKMEYITEYHSKLFGVTISVDVSMEGRDTIQEWQRRCGMNDQTAKADNAKPRLTLVPRQIIWDIAETREYGNRKYHDPDNWRNVEIERYRDALFRHFMAYLDDPDGVDAESGIPHYKHMACNMAFICEMEKKRRDWNEFEERMTRKGVD